MRALIFMAIFVSVVQLHAETYDDLKPTLIHFRAQKHLAIGERQLVQKLKSFHRDTASRVLRFLARSSITEVTDITPLWLTNSIKLLASDSMLRELQQFPEIESVTQEDGKAIFPLTRGEAVHHPITALSWGIEKIRAPELWQKNHRGQKVVVAVIDSGINQTHPDLRNHLWKNPGEAGAKSSNKIDDDTNGYVDDAIGWNFEDNNHDVSDLYGHGTQSAGIIAGSGEGGLKTGVAPEAELMILRTCCAADEGLFESNVWQAIQYALDKSARVISMSLTIKPSAHPNYAKWRRIGEVLLAGNVIHVNSVGNTVTEAPPYDIGAPSSNPPAWKYPGQTEGGKSSMIAVGAVDRDDRVQIFSGIGPVTWANVPGFGDYSYRPPASVGLIRPDVCAPSVVPSTAPDNDRYVERYGGTSSAAPHVAGVAALLLSAVKTLSPGQVTEALQMTAAKVGDDFNNRCGAGRIDAAAALDFAQLQFRRPE